MRCQYCNAELSEGTVFCEKCGQPIADVSQNSGAANRYWNDVDALNTTNEREYKSAVSNAKSEVKARSVATIKKVLLAFIIVAGLFFSVVTLNSNSKKKLEFVKMDAIGNTYSDTSGSSVMSSGDKRDRIIVKIKDENTLSYTRGNYTLRISESGEGYSSSWNQNEIYESSDYEYSFSTSLFGNITLEFGGKSYEVNIGDDGTIYSISFYGD